MNETNTTYHYHKQMLSGCGCLSLMITILCFVIACTWLIKSCERGSLWEGGVETVKEYYQTADSIWNK